MVKSVGHHCLLIAALVLGSGQGAGATSAVSAELCQAHFNEVFRQQDLQVLSNAFNHRPQTDPCSERMLETIRADATRTVTHIARGLLETQNDPDAAARMITGESEASFRLSSIWQVNELRGDIAVARQDWREAASQFEAAYELSLGTLDGAMVKRDAAKPAIQKALYLKASEAMQLSGDFGKALSRSGDASGTFGTRGIKPRKVPVPVEFDHDSAALTPKSLKQVDTIVAFLIKRQYRELEVIGHTDWHGSGEYNQALSERRARSLAAELQRVYLETTDTPLTISSRGLGESCPRVISDSSRFSREQLAALYRRVSLAWPGKAGSEGNSLFKDCDDNGIRE